MSLRLYDFGAGMRSGFCAGLGGRLARPLRAGLDRWKQRLREEHLEAIVPPSAAHFGHRPFFFSCKYTVKGGKISGCIA
jgi:hypothetical protein